mmetsp:Transcript_135528/g.342890  ORF Transcript_135528/g.342890 Transcript_135528/m.342890 type:complete len:266 (-) Transcript_135528:25-822(-)
MLEDAVLDRVFEGHDLQRCCANALVFVGGGLAAEAVKSTTEVAIVIGGLPAEARSGETQLRGSTLLGRLATKTDGFIKLVITNAGGLLRGLCRVIFEGAAIPSELHGSPMEGLELLQLHLCLCQNLGDDTDVVADCATVRHADVGGGLGTHRPQLFWVVGKGAICAFLAAPGGQSIRTHSSLGEVWLRPELVSTMRKRALWAAQAPPLQEEAAEARLLEDFRVPAAGSLAAHDIGMHLHACAVLHVGVGARLMPFVRASSERRAL